MESSLKKSKIPDSLPEMLGKTSGEILEALKKGGNLTIPELAGLIGITGHSIERNIRKLQDQVRLRRIGSAKGGRWEVIE